MKYTETDFPVAMGTLDYKVRQKAIEILNKLLEEGEPIGKSIPIAIDEAADWASVHPEAVNPAVGRKR